MLLSKVLAVQGLVGAFVHSESPSRISFNSLLMNDSVGDTTTSSNSILLDSLTSDGLVSITNIPSFQRTKIGLMSNLHACIMSMNDGDDVPTQVFDDGTIRRSFATSTLPNGVGPQSIKTLDEYEQALRGSDSKKLSTSCQHFNDHLASFRSTVDLVTRKFAERLSVEMGSSLPKPLLSSSSNDGHGNYDDIKEIVEGGTQLEHFHSYQKEGSNIKKNVDETTTIDFHSDQGFFIAFTPGLIISSDTSQDIELSDGFYIQDSNGDKMLMEFTGDDDLVFMLGDGVNQFINNKLVNHDKKLHATPHALTLNAQGDDSQARVWYGRMVLAPQDSSIGETRQFLVEKSTNGDSIPMGIGCSSPNMKAVVTSSSRNLQDDCAEDELYCWFRCQKLTDHGLDVNFETCAAQSTEERKLAIQCVNPRGQVLLDGKGHGDYFPECTDRTAETHPVTPLPMIEQQSEECTSDDWDEFIGSDDYDHMVDLTQPDGTETKLLWTVVEEDGVKKVDARLAFDNVFGWLALGFANQEDTRHNGMNGGSILLAMPGGFVGDYEGDVGLNLTDGGSIATYVIHPQDSAFRHWHDPIETDDAMKTEADFEHNGCFTAITFKSDQINGIKFNLDGSDDLIWGGNSNDHWMGYHSHAHRARFTLDWNKGEMTPFVAPPPAWATADDEEEVKENGDHDDHTHGSDDKHDDEDHSMDKEGVVTESSMNGGVKNGMVGTLAVFASLVYLFAN